MAEDFMGGKRKKKSTAGKAKEPKASKKTGKRKSKK